MACHIYLVFFHFKKAMDYCHLEENNTNITLNLPNNNYIIQWRKCKTKLPKLINFCILSKSSDGQIKSKNIFQKNILKQ